MFLHNFLNVIVQIVNKMGLQKKNVRDKDTFCPGYNGAENIPQLSRSQSHDSRWRFILVFATQVD
jgi:hypothetical protein